MPQTVADGTHPASVVSSQDLAGFTDVGNVSQGFIAKAIFAQHSH